MNTIIEGMKESFNPHSRVGSDFEPSGKFDKILVSIHTPAWGVTWRFQ